MWVNSEQRISLKTDFLKRRQDKWENINKYLKKIFQISEKRQVYTLRRQQVRKRCTARNIAVYSTSFKIKKKILKIFRKKHQPPTKLVSIVKYYKSLRKKDYFLQNYIFYQIQVREKNKEFLVQTLFKNFSLYASFVQIFHMGIH